MMPGSRSSDPDTVWIRIRPDSELLDPVRIWPEPKCLDLVWIRIQPDLKIVDPVHPISIHETKDTTQLVHMIEN